MFRLEEAFRLFELEQAKNAEKLKTSKPLEKNGNLTEVDLLTLNDREWLNDSVINEYLKLIVKSSGYRDFLYKSELIVSTSKIHVKLAKILLFYHLFSSKDFCETNSKKLQVSSPSFFSLKTIFRPDWKVHNNPNQPKFSLDVSNCYVPRIQHQLF